MALAFGRDREAELVQLLGQFVIAQTRGLGRRLQSRLPLAGFLEEGTLRARFFFQLLHAFGRAGELLVQRGALPFERVHFARGFVQLALDRRDQQGCRRMIAACRLVLLAELFETVRFLREARFNFFPARLQDLPVGQQGAMLGRERGDLHFAREKRTVLLVHPAAVDHSLGGNEIAREGGERESGEFAFQTLGLVEIVHENDFA